ncbi:MAG: hypothetical protein OIF57_14455 [Marinobacterium sp.]|nr:hypothetical protein [Marinobacterium sp.]
MKLSLRTLITTGLIICSLLVLPVLSQQALADEEGFELNLQQRLHELLQLNRETMQRINPIVADLQSCIIDQKEALEKEFSLNNLLQAQRACTPLIEKMVSRIGFDSEEEKEEATSQIYRSLIKDSI